MSSGGGLGPLDVIGDFVLPPADGPPSRDFQTLHLDFGLPLDPVVPQDVARYTALHVPAAVDETHALTRFVSLEALLGQRAWPARDALLGRFAEYGHSHGAWDHARGYSEGSLARIVDAASPDTAQLPSVKADPGFLCGTEFPSLDGELDFFTEQGLSVMDVQAEVAVRPGEVVVFDNLALAHGRRGSRRPGELRQWVFGHRALGPAGQREVRDAVLRAFDTDQPYAEAP